jgi:hypothetical protein
MSTVGSRLPACCSTPQTNADGQRLTTVRSVRVERAHLFALHPEMV